MTEKQRKPAPEGYHYMPNGKLMKNTDMHSSHGDKDSYTPLFIILGVIFLATIVSIIPNALDSVDSSLFQLWMGRFMAGFFLVFSTFKLIDITGFAEGYQTYDLLAKKVPVYGLIYPFIELVFGLGYIIVPSNTILNILVAIVLGFSSIGVIQSLREKKSIRCACLGTALKIPLSTVTVVEDIGMVVMALVMIGLS